MRVIIAGSRTLSPSCEGIIEYMYDSLLVNNDSWDTFTEVVSGGARGVDLAGEKFAQWTERKLTVFPADWDKHGKSAGHIRNKQMAEYGDVLLLIWDGESRGSANMKMNMEKLNKPIYEIIIKTHKTTKILYGRN